MAATAVPNSQPFRFLDLPLELQRKTFREFYESWTIKIVPDEEATGRTRLPYWKCDRLPSRALLLVNRHINSEASEALRSAFDRTVTLNLYIIREYSLRICRKIQSALRVWSMYTETLNLKNQSFQLDGFEFPRLRVLDLGSFHHDSESENSWALVLANVLDGKADQEIAKRASSEVQNILQGTRWLTMYQHKEIVIKTDVMIEMASTWENAEDYGLSGSDLVIRLEMRPDTSPVILGKSFRRDVNWHVQAERIKKGPRIPLPVDIRVHDDEPLNHWLKLHEYDSDSDD